MSLQWECCNSDLAFYVRNLKLGHRCHKNNFTRIELKIYFFISDFPESMRLMIVTEKSTSLLVLLFNNLYDHQIQAVISTAKMSCYVSTQLSWERDSHRDREFGQPCTVYQAHKDRRQTVRNHRIHWWVCYSDFFVSDEPSKSLKVEYWGAC